MLIQFTCKNCDETFRIRDRYIDRLELACINCLASFPSESLEVIKNGVDQINKGKNDIVHVGSSIPFSIEVIDVTD